MITEDGSDLAAELWSSAGPVASSILAYPEGRAALAAARRGGRLAEDGYVRAIADFEDMYMELTSVGVDEPLARSAGEYAETFGLRGYDAVHLATALDLGGGEIAFVSWDADLRAAAAEAGLAVAGD